MTDYVRLLACGKCKTIEVLDDYDGPPERADEYDVILNVAVERHQDGIEKVPHAPAALVRIERSQYNDPKIIEAVQKQILESFNPGAETGLGTEAYAMRDNFRADALSCFAAHNRNPACGEYKGSHKRLVPDTGSERRELGASRPQEYDRNRPDLTRYLCEYCPVHSLVLQATRKKQGMYDK